ncbi:MAG: hypothetical protein ACK5PZ_03580 [Pirellula sp.]|jgi:hypothetical protein
MSNQLSNQRPSASVLTRLMFSMIWISWIGCDTPVLHHVEPDYAKRTVSIQKILIDKPCTLGASAPAMVSTGWIPVHFMFTGDEEIIEGMTNPYVRVQIFDQQDNVLVTYTPEFVYKKDSSTFLFACFCKISPEHKGHLGRVELFGNEQLLLIRKLFRVR